MSRVRDIIFVDDDATACELLLRFGEDLPHRFHAFKDPHEALGHYEINGADLVITDLRMPGMTGIELLERIRDADPRVPVIVVTAYASADSAIQALRLGATDFLKKPFDMERLLELVEATLRRTAGGHGEQGGIRPLRRHGMIGDSPAMHAVSELIDKVAAARCNVILSGESGTGKELAASAIHDVSGAVQDRFVVIDCGALSDTLLESELFGHERGAFTGASNAKKGLLVAASGGTVLLDEIGNISDGMQMKLLRVVQERRVTRVGGLEPVDIDVRFIAATNRDLATMVQDGQFRQDLYHRLNVITITMPPLRERRVDIAPLARHFIEYFARCYGRPVTGIDPASLQLLENHQWPGNVRELRNVIERGVVLADDPVLRIDELPGSAGGDDDSIDTGLPRLTELERRYIFKLLERFDGNRRQVAEVLGIERSTLWRKLQKYEREAATGSAGRV